MTLVHIRIFNFCLILMVLSVTPTYVHSHARVRLPLNKIELKKKLVSDFAITLDIGGTVASKKSFCRNKSGGRQLVEMHGVRSVKGKAKSAEQFRLECVYADASVFLFLSPSPFRTFVPSFSHSHSYYFLSVLVTVRTPETKEGKINRESGCEAETVSRKRET